MMNQRTLALVKSAAVARGNTPAIMDRARQAGLTIVAWAPMVLSRDAIEDLYAEHLAHPHFESLAASVGGAAGVVAMVLEGPDAIAVWRRTLGPADPARAPAGTVRHDFGTAITDNAAHGSDSLKSAAREIALLFPDLS